MHPMVFTTLQKDCYDFYIIIQKNFSQILRHIIRLFNNKIGFCSKYSWVQKYTARMQKSIVSMMKYFLPSAENTFCSLEKKASDPLVPRQ